MTIVSYSAEPRSDVTAFLRAGALAAAAEAAASAAEAEAEAEAEAAASSSPPSSSAPAAAGEAEASPASSGSVVVLPVRLPEGARGERSGHYAPLVCPEELGRVAAAAMTTTKEGEERSRF